MGNDTNWLVGRLYALSTAVAKRDWSEFTIRVHAEPKLDADYVLSTAASEISRLAAELAAMTAERDRLRDAHREMHRRCQRAEAGVADYRKLIALPPDGDGVRFVSGSMGRALLTLYADQLSGRLQEVEAERDRLRAACEAVEAYPVDWCEGPDENIERIKQLAREALRKEDTR